MLKLDTPKLQVKLPLTSWDIFESSWTYSGARFWMVQFWMAHDDDNDDDDDDDYEDDHHDDTSKTRPSETRGSYQAELQASPGLQASLHLWIRIQNPAIYR